MPNLHEIPIIGGLYTWSNGDGINHMRPKLDRILANGAWHTIWAQVKTNMVYGTISDHVVLVLTLAELKSGKKPFRYYNSWLRINNFNTVFKDAWKQEIQGNHFIGSNRNLFN